MRIGRDRDGNPLMDIISLSPLRTASLVWQPKPGTWMLTVVCKATFNLTPAQSELAPAQDPVIELDEHWNDDEQRSLHFASELVPMKPRAEVVLVGHAFAPNGQPARAVAAGFTVGTTEKSVEVVCDRYFTHDGALQEGQRFTRMPLVYERAGGGPGSWNPVGVRHGFRDVYGRVLLPNLQPRGMHVRSPDDYIDPIGFGPVAPNWPARRDKLGPHAASFSTQSLASAPLPEGVNYAFFNTAPPDQWLDALRDNERIVLENLHPEHPRLVTSLPGVRPRAFVDGRDLPPQMIEMHADTLIIDTDRGVCSLLFRGLVPLSRADEPGRVLVAMEKGTQTLSHADVARLAREGAADSQLGDVDLSDPAEVMLEVEDEQTLIPRSAPTSSRLLPFGQAPTSTPKEEPRVSKPSGGLPFTNTQSSPPSPPAPPSAPPPLPSGANFRKTATMPFPSGAGTSPSNPSNLPRFMTESAPRPPPAPPSPVASAPSGLPFQPVAAPPMAAPPMAAPPMAAPPMAAPPMAAPPMAVAPPAPVPLASKSAPPAPSSPWAGGAPSNASSQVIPAPAIAPSLRGPGGNLPGSAVAASDAAARADTDIAARPALTEFTVRSTLPLTSAAEKAQRAGVGTVLDLIWYDEAHVPRIRAWWEELVTELDFEPSDPRRDLAAEDPEKAKSRHNVFGIMSDGVAVDAAGISRVIVEAVSDKGRFTPPLALVGGELRFLFDEVETLRATIVAMTPLVGNDKRLKDSIESMNELLKTPYLQGSSGVVEKLTRDLRDQFREANRSLPANHLDNHVERLLLEQRHYMTRKVFGAEFIRALLGMSGGSGGSGGGGEAPIPVYLPKHLDQTLPMLVVMKARLIVTAHLQQDPYDASPYALRVVALGRSIQLEGWRGGGK
jgi:hypothetical protein